MLSFVDEVDDSDLEAIGRDGWIDVGYGPEQHIWIQSIGVMVCRAENGLVAVRHFDTQKLTSSSPDGCRQMLDWLAELERSELGSRRRPRWLLRVRELLRRWTACFRCAESGRKP
ncbi:hypothetical protein [Burkholderia sp. LMG 32019]|uniref:hypothetical protein n=1 Tax=Burkholderia sp. LMG 32019 TaxID=3158173 RepID=UPI003C2BBB62